MPVAMLQRRFEAPPGWVFGRCAAKRVSHRRAQALFEFVEAIGRHGVTSFASAGDAALSASDAAVMP